jgi:hypothetical protein
MASTSLRRISIATRLRSRSQGIALFIGLALTVVGTLALYRGMVIRGSLGIGIGSSILAAVIVAYLSPASVSGYRKFVSFGIVDMWSSRKALSDWVPWMEPARERCVLFGIAHGGWCKDDRFESALKERVSHGVSFRILFLDPNSDAARIRAKEENRDTINEIRTSIKRMWEIRGLIPAGQRELVRIFVYDATASCGLTWIDQQMLVTHYLAGLPDETSPALLLVRPAVGMVERSLYDVYADNLEKILQKRGSRLLDEANIHEFLPGDNEGSVDEPLPKESPTPSDEHPPKGDV